MCRKNPEYGRCQSINFEKKIRIAGSYIKLVILQMRLYAPTFDRYINFYIY